MKMFDALDEAWEKLLIASSQSFQSLLCSWLFFFFFLTSHVYQCAQQEYNNCVYFGRDPKQEGGGDSLFKVTTNFMYFMHGIAMSMLKN